MTKFWSILSALKRADAQTAFPSSFYSRRTRFSQQSYTNMAAITLHRADPQNPIWLESKLSSSYTDRLQLHKALCSAKNWGEIKQILKNNRDDIRSLATILNDCPAWARKLAFAELKSKTPAKYSRCLDAISEFQIHKDILDPDNKFPFVATPRFLQVLNRPLKHCSRCAAGFEEGDDIPLECAKSLRVLKIDSLPNETLENILAYLGVKDAQAVAGVSSRLSVVGNDRLNPVVYLSSTFSNSISLLAEMADNGCVLSGSRALDFFVPGTADNDSDWDFYVNGYTQCAVNMIRALEDSGVEWEFLEDRVRRFLRGGEKSMKVKVGDIKNVQSWGGSHLLDTADLEEDVRHTFKSIFELSVPVINRDENITIQKGKNNIIRFKLPRRHVETEEPGEIDNELDNNGDNSDDIDTGENDSSYYGTFSVITGRIRTKTGSSKVQLIICHNYGLPMHCLQVISRFHSTPVQGFLAGFGAGHMFYDKTASMLGTVWNFPDLSLIRKQKRKEAVAKYIRRGFKLSSQEYVWPTARIRLGDPGTLFMNYTKLYEQFENLNTGMSSPCSAFGKAAHPVAHFLEGLNWGIKNTVWELEGDGPHNKVHPLLKTVLNRPHKIWKSNPDRYPPDILGRASGNDGNVFSLAKYLGEYASGTPGVKKYEDRDRSRQFLRLVLSGAVGELRDGSIVQHIL